MKVGRITLPLIMIMLGMVVALLACALHSIGGGRKVNLTVWPGGASPREIGKRVAENFVKRPHLRTGKDSIATFIPYPESCAWYGALDFARLSGEADLERALVRRFEPLLSGDEKHLIPKADHVDMSVFGIVPLQIYILNQDQRCLDLGRAIADTQWQNPLENGLSVQSRFWIDDMFMITSLQVQAFRATGEDVYLDRAALSMATYLDTLQQDNGLFYHAPDARFFWGRGNGWVAAGMTELLRELPQNHPQRPRILHGYRKMMTTLKSYQDSSGMWHQLIDKADVWPETSCTAMFTFAMITGVKNGWLDPEQYNQTARKGWLGLLTYLDADANIREVCEGTGKRDYIEHYLNRKRNIGDLHGQAPMLWCAAALLR